MYTSNAPLITVILTAYNRRRYLEEAINSALNQTLSKEFYEVIVIKNFEWEHDDHYRNLGVKIINVEEPSLGKKVYLALKKSRGEIITLLNDDDLYSRERLSVVKESFGKYPNLALYHNESSWIDENGKPLKRKTKFFEHHLTRTIYISNPRKYTQSIKLFVSGRCSDSALAFRKGFIQADLHHLANCYLSIDVLLFDLALTSNFGILYDNRRLTYLRLNRGSVTNTPGVNPKFKLSELEILSALTKKNWSLFDIVSTEIARLKINLISAGYINGRITVKDFFSSLLKFALWPDKESTNTLFYSILCLVLPKVAKVVYKNRNILPLLLITSSKS